MTNTNHLIDLAPNALKRNWGWMLGLGLLFILLGCIGLGMVVGLTVVSIVFMGMLFIVAGLAQIVDTFKSKAWRGAAWHALIALLYIVGGGLIVYDPILASTIITALLAWIFIVIGLARITMSIMLRHAANWGWMLLAGLVAVILGVLILAQWPFSALWVIGLFVAIELMVCGWGYVLFALALRKAHA